MSQQIDPNVNGNDTPKKVKKKQKIYWTEDTEMAVKEYLALDYDHIASKMDSYLRQQMELDSYDPTIDDGYMAELRSRMEGSVTDENQRRKERIFRGRIRTPLNRLVENIIFSFKLFRYDIDVKTLHNDCMSHVYEKFYKFDPDQNTKSFSYFGTIAKHYLQNKKKDLDTMKTINLSYDDHHEEVDGRQNYEIDSPKASDELIELFEFMIVEFENNINNKALNYNDRKVLEAILALFKSHSPKSHDDSADPSDPTDNSLMDDLRYNKGNILDFIMDRSELAKDDMQKSLTKLRNLYKEKKKEFYNN